MSDIHEGIHGIVSSFYDISIVESHSPKSTRSEPKDAHKYQSENKKLLGIIQNMENEINKLNATNNKLKSQFEEEKSELEDQISSLEAENKKYLETLIKHSKGEISNMAPVLGSR